MAISRAQLVKELEPGLNALFVMEYDRYDQEHLEIYETENSDVSSDATNVHVVIQNSIFGQKGAGLA